MFYLNNHRTVIESVRDMLNNGEVDLTAKLAGPLIDQKMIMVRTDNPIDGLVGASISVLTETFEPIPYTRVLGHSKSSSAMVDIREDDVVIMTIKDGSFKAVAVYTTDSLTKAARLDTTLWRGKLTEQNKNFYAVDLQLIAVNISDNNKEIEWKSENLPEEVADKIDNLILSFDADEIINQTIPSKNKRHEHLVPRGHIRVDGISKFNTGVLHSGLTVEQINIPESELSKFIMLAIDKLAEETSALHFDAGLIVNEVVETETQDITIDASGDEVDTDTTTKTKKLNVKLGLGAEAETTLVDAIVTVDDGSDIPLSKSECFHSISSMFYGASSLAEFYEEIAKPNFANGELFIKCKIMLPGNDNKLKSSINTFLDD